jgi:cellulose synthase operon protein C
MARFCGVLFLFLAITAACAPREPIPLKVEYAGCKAVLVPGPVCVLNPDRKLQLWVGVPSGEQVEIRAGGKRLHAPGDPVQNGQRFSLVLPSPAKQVSVLAPSREGQPSWSISLAEPENGQRFRDVLAETQLTLIQVNQDLLDRKLAKVRKTLQDVRSRLLPEAPAESRYELSYYRCMLADKEGDHRSALAEVKEAVAIAERVKLERYQWLAEEKLALLLLGVGRFQEAAHTFERLRRKPQAWDTCEMADLLTNHGWSALLAREAGESLEDPAPLFEEALATYETCADVELERKVNILINLALAHVQEGRLQQAKDLLARARGLEPHPPLSHTLWQLDLEARIELKEGRPAEALHRFEELEKLARDTSSPDGRLRAAFGQARSYEALRDRPEALDTLREAEALLDEQSLQIPVHAGRERFMAARQAIVGLHVQILLDEGRNAQALGVVRHARSRMLRQLARTDSLASLKPEQRESWERHLTAYQEKRAALEERTKNDWKLPADRLRLEQETRKAEAEAGRKLLDEAFRALPAERRREEPPPPRQGELILAYHPILDGWAGFAADGKTVAVHRFKLPPNALDRPHGELAEHLLLPFRDAIERADRIRILTSGPLQGVDFHALPFGGDILLAAAPVVYGLDLPVSARPAQTSEPRRALLVADPRDDLPGTLDEAGKVLAILKSGPRPWIVEELKSTDASAEAVQDQLPRADLMHYAGHSSYSGSGGWESSLLLAEDTRLILGDLLALKRVPAWVVLSGCETGRSSTETPVESLGLAHAFLLAGSRAAVASIRRAGDRELPAFFPELYRQWDREPDLAVALQRAQLSWRKRAPGADWKSFRLFEP